MPSQPLASGPRGAALLVVSDFHTELAAPEVRERDERIAAALVEEGLEDMSIHFFAQLKLW